MTARPRGVVAHHELGQEIGQRAGVETRVDDATARAHDAADPGREIVGQLMSLERVLHHGQGPPLELRARRMQPVVDRRDRHPQEGGDVLVGAVVHVVERDDFSERSGQCGDRRQHGADFLAALDPAIGSGLVGRHRVGAGQRHGLQMLAPEYPVSAVPHDAPEPAGERRRLGEGRQRVPGRHECFLDDVFRLAEVADEGQRVAEGHVLEAPGELGKGVEIASCRGPNG